MPGKNSASETLANRFGNFRCPASETLWPASETFVARFRNFEARFRNFRGPLQKLSVACFRNFGARFRNFRGPLQELSWPASETFLACFTGLVWSSKGNFRSRALQQAQEAEIIVVEDFEEAQQTPDVKTTLSLSHADARSLLLLVGDEQQAPG